MQKKISSFLFLVAVLLSRLAFSQSEQEKQLAAAVETLRMAMINADSLALDRLTADKLTYGHSSGKIEDKTNFIQSLSSGRSDFVNINLTDQQITLFGETGIVRHILSAETNDGGKPGTVKLSVLTVWKNMDGKWKLIARQAVKVQ